MSENALLYERCRVVEEQIKLGLQVASVVCADETGACSWQDALVSCCL